MDTTASSLLMAFGLLVFSALATWLFFYMIQSHPYRNDAGAILTIVKHAQPIHHTRLTQQAPMNVLRSGEAARDLLAQGKVSMDGKGFYRLVPESVQEES